MGSPYEIFGYFNKIIRVETLGTELLRDYIAN